MKQLRTFPQAVVSRKAAASIGRGHPWVFDAEVRRIEPAPSDGRVAVNGDLVDVLDEKGGYLGTGLLSEQSKIRVRLVSRNANDRFDEAFWERKLRWAWDYRVATMGGRALPGAEPDTSCCRVVFSEADAFPGLVIDRYEDVLVSETLTFGMERLRPLLLPMAVRVLREAGQDVRAVYERNDAAVREKEGLPRYKGFFELPAELTTPLAGEPAGEELTRVGAGAQGAGKLADAGAQGAGQLADAAGEGITRVGAGSSVISDQVAGNAGVLPAPSTHRVICENGVRYELDLENSQKTGFFLDQKYNRRAVARLARGRRVLDCFTHVGSFALNCALAGAEFVRGVDVSAMAVDLCRRNARLNGVADRADFTVANVFDYLPGLEADHGKAAGGPFDLIVLDPPAFTKSRRTAAEAARGYRQINYRAMRLLPRGGYLATCSCSHFMPADKLREVLAEAAHDAGVQLRQVEERQQAPDHPIVYGIPESEYLKFFVFQVI